MCPATVPLAGKITTNGKGDVDFRIIHNGAKGPVKTAKFVKADTFEFDVDLEVGKQSGGTNSFKSADNVPHATPGGFKIAAAPKPGAKGPTDLAAHGANTHTGWVAIETTSPQGKTWKKSFYTVVCTGPQVNEAVVKGAPKGMTVAPRPVQAVKPARAKLETSK
jgi:hypothetical protein